MATTDSQPVFALVLAAGSASRFGATKQLAAIDGTAMVRRALDTATACCGENTLLVLGHDWHAVRAACRPNPGFFVINDQHQDGLGTSIAGAVSVSRHAAQAIIILLADQVLVSAQHVCALRAAWSGADHEIVATNSATSIGPPVLFGRGCFDDLMQLRGDTGGRHLFSDMRFRLHTVRCDDAAVDIDTPEDLRRILHSARN